MENEAVKYAGHLHILLWIFPALFFGAALVSDVLACLGRERALRIGHWLVILGVISSIPVITTGLAEAGNVNPEDYFLAKHRYLGIAVGVWGSLYAGLRISSMFWDLPLAAKHYAFLSMLMLALIWWTCDYGWLISRS